MASPSRNELIRAIPAAQRPAFVADLRSSVVTPHTILVAAGATSSPMYFPIGAVVSMFYASSGTSIELLGVGCEGMLGIGSPLLGTGPLRYDIVCQIGGPLFSMSARAFARHRRGNVAIDRVSARYSLSVLAFLSQSVACNALHSIAERCARWLLITSDRVGASEFALTHEALARLLGAGRPGVSVAVHRLQSLGVIAYRSGRMRVLDPARLKAESCECYGIILGERAKRGGSGGP